MDRYSFSIHRLIASVAVLFFIGFNVFLFSDQSRYHEMTIQNDRGVFKLKVEIAQTFRQMRRGLMHRRRLDVGRGMLFVYDKPHIPSFWMKNTRIPLDMIFIGEDLRIKTIHEKVPPCLETDDCPTYEADQLAQYVLEVPGGYSSLFKIKVGDLVTLPLID